MDDSAQGDREYVRGKAQWRMGIAALRKVRNVVDGYEEDKRFRKAEARYVTAGFVLVVILVLGMALFAPATIQNLFRSLS